MKKLLFAAALICAPTLAFANALVPSGTVQSVAKSSLSARAAGDWNRLKIRPGKRAEIWTLDGPILNQVVFFGGVPVGEPLFREADRKRAPLPKVQPNMLVTDIASLFEATYRASNRAFRMEIDTQEPAEFAGAKGVRFTYRFVRDEDDVERRGEAFGATRDGKLYLMVYEAPGLHFFDKDREKFLELVRSARM